MHILSFTVDETLTEANINEIVNDVQDWEVLGVLLGIQDPDSLFNKIKQIYKDPDEQKKAMISHWYSTHPIASWGLLHQALKMKGEIEAATAVQQKFLKGIEFSLPHVLAIKWTYLYDNGERSVIAPKYLL